MKPFPIDNYFTLVHHLLLNNKSEYRYGQALFLVLQQNWPKLAKEIRGDGHFDPYYIVDAKHPVMDRFTFWLIKSQIEEKENGQGN